MTARQQAEQDAFAFYKKGKPGVGRALPTSKPMLTEADFRAFVPGKALLAYILIRDSEDFGENPVPKNSGREWVGSAVTSLRGEFYGTARVRA